MSAISRLFYQSGFSATFQFTKRLVTHPITTFVIGLFLDQWVHEKAHCVAAEIMYDKSESQIAYIRGIVPGHCSYYQNTPSALGIHLGYRHANALITAAGPLVETVALTSIAAFSSNNGAKQLLPYTCLLSFYIFTDLLNDGKGDFAQILDYNIYAYGALTLTCLLSTAYIAHRAFSAKAKTAVKTA